MRRGRVDGPSGLSGPAGGGVFPSPRPGRWSSHRSRVRPGRYTTKSQNKATTENPRTTIRNCQTSDAITFLSAPQATVLGAHIVSYISAASAVTGLPRPQGSGLPERWIEKLRNPDPCVLRPQHRVMVCAF